jgi:uncharacterized protein (DUF58 family)
MSGPRNRHPSISPRGASVFALGVLLLILAVGQGSLLLAAAGLFSIALLLAAYLAFAARVALVWRRQIELVWWLPRAASNEGLVAGRPFEAQLGLSNHTPLDLGQGSVSLFGSRAISVEKLPSAVRLLPGQQAMVRLLVRPLQAGQWMIHGAALRLSDPLALFSVEAYYPSALPLKILPRPQPRAAIPPSRIQVATGEERLGAHSLRKRGQGGELRELRDYVPGDPFKLIAWKASARAPMGRLLVRELDRDLLLTHYVLLDMGATMREGQPGAWKLDHAIELALGYCTSMLAAGDRVGLIVFDSHIYRHHKPGDGPSTRLRICEQLLSSMNVVEEGFAAVTEGELVAAVARYLRQQEGLEARSAARPALSAGDAQQAQDTWSTLSVGPHGELYDLAPLLAAAQRMLPSAQQPVSPPTDAASGLRLLRQLCRVRGIELPYAQRTESARADGLVRALELASHHPSSRVLLLSDLLGIDENAPRLAQVAALCRRRALHLTCLQPRARRYLPPELVRDPTTSQPAAIFGWEHDRQEQRMHRVLAKIGFHVIAVGPKDSLAHALSQTSRPVQALSSSDADPPDLAAHPPAAPSPASLSAGPEHPTAVR